VVPQNTILTKSTAEESIKSKIADANDNVVAMERVQGSGKAYDPLHENHYR
jgi:hypothetical protein